jgi:hypothetical protein
MSVSAWFPVRPQKLQIALGFLLFDCLAIAYTPIAHSVHLLRYPQHFSPLPLQKQVISGERRRSLNHFCLIGPGGNRSTINAALRH